MENTLEEALVEQRDCLVRWMQAPRLPEDIREGMEISFDKIDVALRAHRAARSETGVPARPAPTLYGARGAAN